MIYIYKGHYVFSRERRFRNFMDRWYTWTWLVSGSNCIYTSLNFNTNDRRYCWYCHGRHLSMLKKNTPKFQLRFVRTTISRWARSTVLWSWRESGNLTTRQFNCERSNGYIIQDHAIEKRYAKTHSNDHWLARLVSQSIGASSRNALHDFLRTFDNWSARFADQCTWALVGSVALCYCMKLHWALKQRGLKRLCLHDWEGQKKVRTVTDIEDMVRELKELRVAVRSIRDQSTERGRSREKSDMKQSNRGKCNLYENIWSVTKTLDDHGEIIKLHKEASKLRTQIHELSRQFMK